MKKDMPSVNERAAPLVDQLENDATALQIAVSRLDNGARLIDAGIRVPGSLEAGKRIIEICLGGLGTVKLEGCQHYPGASWAVHVASEEPVLACLGSQYAGWDLQHTEGGKRVFTALGSGPARAMGSNESLYEVLGYRDRAESACIVMEVDRFPPLPLVKHIASRCCIEVENLTLILTPTTSICGVVQIVGRILETALHKIHILDFPLHTIVAGSGTVPVCPVSDDFIMGMGRTNDAILFGGEVCLQIDAEDDRLEDLAQRLPSDSSRDYGKPFHMIFKEVDCEFYKIDPMLFSPAQVSITSVRSGRRYRGGEINLGMLERSFA